MKTSNLINSVQVIVSQAKAGRYDGIKNLKAMREAIDNYLLYDNIYIDAFDNGRPMMVSDTEEDVSIVAFATKRCTFLTLQLTRQVSWVGLVQLKLAIDEFIDKLEADR